jgi:hypothetical protein
MATREQLEAANERMRALLDDAGLPRPDEVEYGEDEIVLKWHDSRTAIVIDSIGQGPDQPLPA